MRNKILLIDAGAGGGADRAITDTLEQRRAYNCDRYTGGIVQGIFWNFGNADNYARVSCVAVGHKPYEFPFYHGTTPQSSSLFDTGSEMYVAYVLASDTPAEYVPFVMQVPEINAAFWKWRVEVFGTDKSTNCLLEFYPK